MSLESTSNPQEVAEERERRLMLVLHTLGAIHLVVWGGIGIYGTFAGLELDRPVIVSLVLNWLLFLGFRRESKRATKRQLDALWRVLNQQRMELVPPPGPRPHRAYEQ